MLRLCGRFIVISLLTAAAGCVTVTSAPGASQVRLTQNSAEVAGCTPVGNIHLSPNDQGFSSGVMFRNRVVGFGGNTGLVTKAILASQPIEGIAYRCHSRKTSAAH